ncbi:hypothetical protein DS745_04015 [Anaerobacillus alkaliphilus]|uniref:Uncharacterized protein n=1 Tax=Anaerobacillus alkaliphilus TaxID=1548597 RepID=A0A4Q0W020_9BACI|nr:CBO0543 family protein [Anaerobacillus alkaliphilus]RXJ04558.1 hypothetical protein DS745_04015 [Anaerobacillus alkaliphilus]
MEPIANENKVREVKQFYDRVAEVNADYQEYWMEHSFGHWDFWLTLFLAVIPWLIWFIVRKKENQGRLLLAGFLMLIFSSWFDFLGVVFGLWYYTIGVLPTIPSYVTWDFSIFPVLTMLLIQFKPKINPWLKAIGFSLINAFLGEPLMTWLGIYVKENWSVFYSTLYRSIYCCI